MLLICTAGEILCMLTPSLHAVCTAGEILGKAEFRVGASVGPFSARASLTAFVKLFWTKIRQAHVYPMIDFAGKAAKSITSLQPVCKFSSTDAWSLETKLVLSVGLSAPWPLPSPSELQLTKHNWAAGCVCVCTPRCKPLHAYTCLFHMVTSSDAHPASGCIAQVALLEFVVRGVGGTRVLGVEMQ